MSFSCHQFRVPVNPFSGTEFHRELSVERGSSQCNTDRHLGKGVMWAYPQEPSIRQGGKRSQLTELSWAGCRHQSWVGPFTDSKEDSKGTIGHGGLTHTAELRAGFLDFLHGLWNCHHCCQQQWVPFSR